MRVMVLGISGAGKSTFASKLSAATAVQVVELDLLNWGPGWHNCSLADPAMLWELADRATEGGDWIVAGGYSQLWPLMWPRAEALVWLDLPRWQVMAQVIPRSLARVLSGKDVFPGRREDFGRLLRADHPIRWAWNNHRSRRERITAALADPVHAHLRIYRCQSRADARAALNTLGAAASR